MKNYFLSVLCTFLCLSLFSQTPANSYKDSTENLAQAAMDAIYSYDYNRAIGHSLNLISLASKKDDFRQLNRGYNYLGVIYETLEDFPRAQENYEKSLQFAEFCEDETALWYAYNNLGNVYSSQPATVEKGLEYYRKAIEISSRLPDAEKNFMPVLNIGWTYLDNEQYDKAYPYLEKVNTLLGEEEDPVTKSDLFSLFGMYYSGKGMPAKSRENFVKAIDLAEADSLVSQAAFAYGKYAEMLFGNRNFEEAYAALEKHQEYKEKLFQKEKNLEREAVYGRFETEEYKKNLALARQEQLYKDQVIEKTEEITLIMIVSLIVMFAFLLLLFRSNRIRKTLIAQLRDKNNELRAAKDEAERLSVLKTRFFSTVSHELRTPLYGVVGLASLLLEENENEDQKEDLKSLKFSADYLLALINDVLQMNKIDSNLVHLENGNFNIKELFSGIVKSFETSHNENRNTIELYIDPNIPEVLVGDSMRLSQIVMNLMGNALKFTEDGTVWLKAEKINCAEEECEIYFEIGDTGVGIPQDKQNEIFEEFSQLKSQNQHYQGTGLGLPIVKKLLQLFGSEILVDSQEGRGSVFSFVIRFKRGEEAALHGITGSDNSESGFSSVALIVDDNRINQLVTRRILEKKNFTCLVAGSGEDAIEILRSRTVDMVLMDVNMPGMNGMQTTQEIRKFNSAVPVIALTAVEVGEMREEILSAGMNDIINKPYDIPQFFNTIFRNLAQPVA